MNVKEMEKRKRKIIQKSRFTIGYDKNSLGFIAISPSELSNSVKNIEIHSAIYGNRKNNKMITLKFQNQMKNIGLYKDNLFGNTPTSKYGIYLNSSSIKSFLARYNSLKLKGGVNGVEKITIVSNPIKNTLSVLKKNRIV